MNNTPNVLRYRKAAASLSAALLAQPLLTQAQSWDSGGSPNLSWNLNTNWNPNTLPAWGNTVDLTFDLAASTQSYFGNAVPIVRSITIGSLVDTAFEASMRSATTGAISGTVLARNLTFSSSTGTASLSVDSGSAGQVTFGIATGHAAGGGAIILTSDLNIAHNGTGELLFNRPLQGAGALTKTGTGTFRYAPTVTPNSYTGTININQGRFIFAAVNGASNDFGATAAINLGGGIMEVSTTTALNKSFAVNTTVSSASTLAYNNSAATDQGLTVGTGTMALNANLTVQNISSSVAGNNIVNISRNLTGSGDLIVDTYNDVASGAVAFSNGRVQLSGDNTAWTGNLVVAKGTAQFSGANSFVPAAGSITLGTTGNSFGAGLGFNQAGADVTVSNAINVTTGGVRLIRNNSGPGSSNEIALDGTVTLNGDLTLDHAGLGATESISVNGNVTGSGSLNVTFVGPHPVAGSAVRFNGHKAYTGATNIGSGASLILGASSSLASSAIDVGAGATFDVSASPFTLASGRSIGGTGTVDGAFTFGAGSNLIFNTSAALNMTGAVSFGGFGVTNLVGLNSSTIAATYTVLNGSGSNIDFTNLANVGPAQAVSLGGGLAAYFDTANGDLAVTVSAIPEPGAFALLGGLSVLGAVATRRRRGA
jgi:hypothetical protein